MKVTSLKNLLIIRFFLVSSSTGKSSEPISNTDIKILSLAQNCIENKCLSDKTRKEEKNFTGVSKNVSIAKSAYDRDTTI